MASDLHRYTAMFMTCRNQLLNLLLKIGEFWPQIHSLKSDVQRKLSQSRILLTQPIVLDCIDTEAIHIQIHFKDLQAIKTDCEV